MVLPDRKERVNALVRAGLNDGIARLLASHPHRWVSSISIMVDSWSVGSATYILTKHSESDGPDRFTLLEWRESADGLLFWRDGTDVGEEIELNDKSGMHCPSRDVTGDEFFYRVMNRYLELAQEKKEEEARKEAEKWPQRP